MRILRSLVVKRSHLLLAALSLFWGLTLWAATEPNPDGVKVRSFLRDMIAASAKAPAQKAQAMREVFAHHPEMFQWMAEERTPNELLVMADLGEFKTPIVGKAEATRLIQEECQKFITDAIADPKFKKDLSELVHKQLPDLMNDPNVDSARKKGAKFIADQYTKLSPEERLTLLSHSDDKAFLLLANKADEAILKAKISDSDAIHLLVSDKAMKIENHKVDPEEVKRYFNQYFDNIALEDRKRMFQAFLAIPPGAPVEKELAAVLQESGPGMQKLVQLFGKDSPDPFVQKVMEQFLENLKPLDFADVRATVERTYGDKLENVFLSFDREPLGSATIGVTYKAKLKTGEDIAIKIRRPGIREAIEREMLVIEKAAKGTQFEKVVAQIRESLLSEVDFKNEAENLRKAVAVYSHPEKGLFVASRVESLPLTEDVIATHLAPGKSMAKLKEASAAWRAKAMEEVARAWFKNVVFGRGEFAGFFHGDLHPGNEFLQRITKNEHGLNYRYTMIDAGSAGTITLEQRRGFIHLALGAAGEAPEQLLYGLGKIQTLTPEQKEKILARLKLIDWNGTSMSQRVSQTLLAANDAGVTMPTDFLRFKRGMEFIETYIDDLNERLAVLDPTGKKLKPVNMTRIYGEITAKELALDLPKQLVSGTAREQSVVNIKEMYKALLRTAPNAIAHYRVMVGQCLRAMMQKYFGTRTTP